MSLKLRSNSPTNYQMFAFNLYTFALHIIKSSGSIPSGSRNSSQQADGLTVDLNFLIYRWFFLLICRLEFAFRIPGGFPWRGVSEPQNGAYPINCTVATFEQSANSADHKLVNNIFTFKNGLNYWATFVRENIYKLERILCRNCRNFALPVNVQIFELFEICICWMLHR